MRSGVAVTFTLWLWMTWTASHRCLVIPPTATTNTNTTSTTSTVATASPPDLSGVVSAASAPPVDLWDYLPWAWATFCSVEYDADPEVSATVQCHVPPNQKEEAIWRLADFREALTSVVTSLGLEIAVRLDCGHSGGTVSLPFPFRAPGLVKLTVRHCRLLDKWGDFTTPAQRLGDWLRVMDFRHCVWANDPAMLRYLRLHLDQMDSHYDCGQDSTLVVQISRNISQESLSPAATASTNSSDMDGLASLLGLEQVTGGRGNVSGILNTTASASAAGTGDASDLTNLLQSLVNGSDSERPDSGGGGGGGGGSSGGGDDAGVNGTAFAGNSTKQDAAADVLNTLIAVDNLKTKCRYEHLEVVDESYSHDTSTSHFEFMVKDSVFPKLRLLNESGIGMREIPVELREFRRKFPGSPLEVIDLSHNFIQDLGRIPMFPSRGVHTRLIVRHNNITRMTLQTFQDLALVPDFTVDLGGNPFACDCDLKDLLMQLRNLSLWEGSPGMGYYRRHVGGLTCASPQDLAGRTLDSLRVDDLPCPVVPADLRPAMIVLMVVVVILLVLLVLAVKYRKEVRILMYTRVHILLPCGLPNQPPSASAPEKTYDAFVAYAHQDSDWVLGSLLKRLEDPTGNPKGRRPFKLCIHQRDFVVGKPIIDNIVDSIAASRHTIVILSRSFVRSGWSMEELEHAYRQSIEERRRHLVVVVLEDVPQEQRGAVLRRCCKTFTYLNVSDTFFWDRLLFSIQVGNLDAKSKKRRLLPLNNTVVEKENGDKSDVYDDVTGSGTVNKGYNFDTAEEKPGKMSLTPADPSLPEEMKRAVFLDTMRMLSVESTVSDTKLPISPNQVRLERPLFDTEA